MKYHDPQSARIKALDAEVARLKAATAPHQPAQWERDAAMRAEVVTLRARVLELERQLDECVDAMTKAELRGTPSSAHPKVGRPRGRRPKAKPPKAPRTIVPVVASVCVPVKVPRARPIPKTNRTAPPRTSKGPPL